MKDVPLRLPVMPLTGRINLFYGSSCLDNSSSLGFDNSSYLGLDDSSYDRVFVADPEAGR